MQMPWQTTRKLRFGDCDFAGMAYYPAYMRMLDGVNEEFWSALGYPWHSTISAERWATPTVHLCADFAAPSHMGDELAFDLTIAKVGTSSVTFNHRITCGDAPRWSATQVLVAIDTNCKRPMQWPDAVGGILRSLCVDPG